MIAYIRQTAKEFRYQFINRIAKMLIQPVIFNKKKDNSKVHSYIWTPNDVSTSASHDKSVATSELKSEVYAPRTLHVEDNAEIRSIVNYFLKKDFDLQFAPDGNNALNLINRYSFDVIIMDINLGDGIDGIETARQIRKLDSYRNVPIIAVTANLSSATRDSCLEVGMDAFLPKPFRREDLVNTINFVLERNGAAGV